MKCRTCYFYQEGKCILHKNVRTRFFCTTHVKKIIGIDDTAKYLDIVYGRKHNLRVLLVSILSLLVSGSLLVVKVLEQIKQH